MIFLFVKSIVNLVLLFSCLRADGLESKLKMFHQNPKQFYMQHIPKYNLEGKQVSTNILNTKSADKIAKIKDTYRNKFFALNKGTKKHATEKKDLAPPDVEDNAQMLVDGGIVVDNIFEIEKQELNESSLKESPWSGDYWPVYRGILGYRFLDKSYPLFYDWKQHHDYSQQTHFYETYKTGQLEAINELSVSEKYDLIVGDPNGALTNSMWEEGREYYELDGKVERWMGICHGWAAAAIMAPRPSRSLQVLAFDGKTKLNINPSELKGLVSYLWANNDFSTRYIGGRCSYRDVKRDENGRPLAPECFDTNPATWFLSVVNQIGVARRSFVMDATPDYEVWNQPVYGYSVKYFNPQSLKETAQLKNAIVSREEYQSDKFKKYRTNNVVYIVGIEMKVRYVVEESANDRAEDSASHDSIRTVSYIFDLELDANHKIIGGEWYTDEHPDFLWVPDVKAQAQAPEEVYLDSSKWDGYETLPLTWRRVAKNAAGRRRVLSSIVNKLLERAQ